MTDITTRQRISTGLLLAIVLPAAGGLIAWGSNLTKVQEIDQHLQYQDAQVQALRGQLVESQRTIAVEGAQYAEILRRLDQIDRKLETPP